MSRITPCASILTGLLMLTLAFNCVPISGDRVEKFDAQPAVTMSFATGGGTDAVNIKVPYFSASKASTMNITGLPYVSGGSEYPTNVVVDVGDDGISDWEFNGTGYGSFGHQDRISNGSASVGIALNNGVSKAVDVKMPKGGVVSSASMTFKGYASAPVRKNVSKTYLQVNGTKTYSSNITGIPPGVNINGLNASVGLKSLVGLKNTTDVVQDSMNGFSANPSYSANWVGQTFRINVRVPPSSFGLLYRIDVYTQKANNPLDSLYLEIYNTTGASNFPIGNNLSVVVVKNSNVQDGGYTSFILTKPIVLDLSKIYAFVLTSPNSQFASGYYQFGNDVNPYNVNGCWEIYSATAGSIWNNIPTSDLRFKTYVKGAKPLVGNDFNNITVSAIPYTSKSGSTLYYNFTNPTYTNGKWPYSIKNSNPFDIIFNLSVDTYYKEYPLGIQLDIGDDGSVDWSSATSVTSTVLTTDLTQKFNAALQSATGTADPFGNMIAPVPLRINSSGNGTLELSKIDIKYGYTAKMTGFGPDIDAYVNNHGVPGGIVQVPIQVTSTSAGKILLNGLNYTYDGPPVNTKLMPLSLTVKEDSKKVRLTDLNGYFADDYDTSLTYSVVNWSPKDVIVIGIDEGHWLTADLANATNGKDWNGDVSIHGIKAADSNGFYNITGSFVIHVTPVNDPPAITSVPVTTAVGGQGYIYDVNATDIQNENEKLTYSLDVKPLGMTIDTSVGLISWVPTWAQQGLNNVTVNVSDGSLFVLQSFKVNVTSTDHAPRFTSVPALTAWVKQEYRYEVTAYDEDVNDVLVYSLDATHPWGMKMVGTIITWTPGQTQTGKNKVVVHVSDGLANITQEFEITVGTNEPPHINSQPVIKAKVGQNYYYNATATDADQDNLNFSLKEKPPTMAITKDGRITWTPVHPDENFTWIVVVVVTDGKAETTQRFNITVDPKDVVKPHHNETSNWQMWAILAVIIIVIVIVIVAVLVVSQRKKGKKDDKKEWPNMGGGTKGEERPSPKVVPKHEETATEEAGGTVIEDVFVIYHDGRLITHQARRLAPEMDSDIVSSMLTAIMNFIKDSFSKGEEGNLKSFEYGEKKILLSHREKVYLAMVMSGKESPGIRARMNATLSEIEYKFGDKLKDWNGRIDEFKGIGKTLKPLVAMSRGEKEQALESELVNLLGNVEFYKGFIVVKVSLMNGAATVITDSDVKLVYNSDALRLDHIMPELRLTGSEVRLGNLAPGERKTAAFYLDPMICLKSNIDATVSFKDSKGTLRTKGMEQLKAEVVCPILYSDEEVNVAMLKRLIGDLQVHDNKVFPLPRTVTLERAQELGKEVLASHRAKLVREFKEETPFSAEAWYYGRSKVSKKPVVTRLSVAKATNTVEFFVATDELPALTGLLAELGHEYAKALRTEARSDTVGPITDQSEREKVLGKTKLLIDRYGSEQNEAELKAVDQE